MEKQIKELLSHWNVYGELHQIKDNVWTVGEDYVLKSNTKLDWLLGNITMLKSLKKCGIPVANIIPTVDECDYLEYDGVYYLCMSKLKGSHITDIYRDDTCKEGNHEEGIHKEDANKKEYSSLAYDTGKVLAKLHQAFLVCEPDLDLWDSNLIEEMTGWIKDKLIENQYRYVTEKDYYASVDELKDCYHSLPRQLIHRDIHYGNLLYDNGLFTGYIDFDLTQKNVRIFDICYFLMGLLIGHEKNSVDVSKWYEFIHQFIRGYEESNPLTELEKDSICCIMKSIELLFVAYFLGSKDEVSAEKSAALFYFVVENDKRIREAVHTRL